MADYIITSKKQSLAEVRQWDFDFTNDLPEGVTVSSATATHTPPSGSASTPTVGAISGGVVPVLLGPLSATGWHELHVLATLSTGKSEMRLKFRVDF